MTCSVNQSISDEAVYRTAPATPGLLISAGIVLKCLITNYPFNLQDYISLEGKACTTCSVWSAGNSWLSVTYSSQENKLKKLDFQKSFNTFFMGLNMKIHRKYFAHFFIEIL